MPQPPTVLLAPFSPTAHLTLERSGPVDDPGGATLDLDVGGYVMVYVGRPGTGNIDAGVEAPAGLPVMHSSNAVGGAFCVRDRLEAVNLAVQALAFFDGWGVLGEAVEAMQIAAAHGIPLGELRREDGRMKTRGH